MSLLNSYSMTSKGLIKNDTWQETADNSVIPTTDKIYFELGFIRVVQKTPEGEGRHHNLASEEITITVTTENIPRYVCDIQLPVDIAPTKKKFSFAIKKPKFFEDDFLYINAFYSQNFDLKLYRMILAPEITDEKKALWKRKNSGLRTVADAVNQKVFDASDKGGDAFAAGDFVVEHVMTLHHCRIDSHSFGNFDGTKPVTEDIQGIAEHMTFSPNVEGYYRDTLG